MSAATAATKIEEIAAEVSRSDLLQAVKHVGKIASSRSTLPILSCVLISPEGPGLAVSATDLEAFCLRRVRARVSGFGMAALPSKILVQILGKVPDGVVRLASKNGKVWISSGARLYEMDGFAPEDFPARPDATDPFAHFDAKGLAAAFSRAAKVASDDSARPVLTSLAIYVRKGSAEIVSTDSYRLGIEVVTPLASSGTRDVPVLIPAKPASALSSLVGKNSQPVGLGVSDGFAELTLEDGSLSLYARLVEGEFPNWEALVPKDAPNHLAVESQEILAAVEALAPLASKNTPVRLELPGAGATLSVNEAGVGKATQKLSSARYDGEPMTVAFNPRFVSDGVSFVGDDEIRIAGTDPLKPWLFGEEERRYLLMPVRLP